jgi:hypothetical protein
MAELLDEVLHRGPGAFVILDAELSEEARQPVVCLDASNGLLHRRTHASHQSIKISIYLYRCIRHIWAHRQTRQTDRRENKCSRTADRVPAEAAAEVVACARVEEKAAPKVAPMVD